MKKRHLIALLMALGIVFTGCNSNTVEEINNALKEKEQQAGTSASTEAISEESATESESVSESTSSASGSIEESTNTEKPSGTYVYTYVQDYVDGEVTCEDIYTFNDDGTGTAEGQDMVPITWDDKYIYMNNEPYAEYKLEGDILKEHKLNSDTWTDYKKSTDGSTDLNEKVNATF
ncbi:MAG: hypothetical protein J5504_09535 [Butyrivibrio sp.]|nr:hypothetical protein [Butyrivibrio sp.]